MKAISKKYYNNKPVALNDYLVLKEFEGVLKLLRPIIVSWSLPLDIKIKTTVMKIKGIVQNNDTQLPLIKIFLILSSLNLSSFMFAIKIMDKEEIK